MTPPGQDRPVGEDAGAPWWLIAPVMALAVVGIVVNVWRPLAPDLPSVATDLDDFAPSVLDVVGAYAPARLWTALASLAVVVSVPALALTLAGGRRAVRRVASIGPPVLGGALVGAGLVVLGRVLLLPLSAWVGHVRELQWGFRTAGLGAWLRDWALTVGVEAVVAGVAGAGWLLLVRRRPADWHWWLVPLATALSGVLVFVHPLLVQPLFLDTVPLEDGPLRDRLEAVLDAAGTEAGVTVGDASRRTTRVNAFVTGLGPSRQVVLWDTLLDRPDDEVAVVVAHELAHRVHRDIARGTLLTAAGVLPFALVLRRVVDRRRVRDLVGASQMGDPAMVAVLAVVVAAAQVVGLPASLWFSRRAEAAADHRALTWTQAPEPLVRTFRGFVVRDLAWPDPPAVAVLLLGTHPPVDARIRSVVAAAVAQGLPLPEVDVLRAAEADQRHSRLP